MGGGANVASLFRQISAILTQETITLGPLKNQSLSLGLILSPINKFIKGFLGPGP